MVIVNDIVTGSLLQFIDGAMGLVTLMLVYYIFKFFFVSPPDKKDKEKALADRQQAWGQFWDKRKKSSEEKAKAEKEDKERRIKEEEKKKKKDLVSPVKENVIDAVEALEEAIDSLDHCQPDKVREFSKKFNKSADKAWGNLRLLRRNQEKEADKNYATQLITKVETAKKVANDAVKDHLKKSTDPHWTSTAKTVRDELMKARGDLGIVFKGLEQFHQ